VTVEGPEVNLFDAVGGRPWFDALVERFYRGVANDPVLRPLYPEDLTASIGHTAGFLAQYWGGGTAQYSDERGHPRLRMRHGHVAIGRAERDAWLHHMTEAVEESDAPPEVKATMLAYFEMASVHMINTEV
jgi:hemoglobin